MENEDVLQQISKLSNMLRHRGRKYPDIFIKNKQNLKLIEHDIMPNMKEITESMGAYNAVKKYIKEYTLSDPEVHLFSVGDGCTPRTASLFALNSAWKCYAIDPNLKMTTCPIERVYIIKQKIEDIGAQFAHIEKAIIVCVHSHAKLSCTMDAFEYKYPRYYVNIPCCVFPDVQYKPFKEYYDYGIWSPQNKVQLYKTGEQS